MAGRPVGKKGPRQEAWACLSRQRRPAEVDVRETLPSKDRSPIHQTSNLYWCPPQCAPRRYGSASTTLREDALPSGRARAAHMLSPSKSIEIGGPGAAYGEELHQIVDGAISEWPVPLTRRVGSLTELARRHPTARLRPYARLLLPELSTCLESIPPKMPLPVGCHAAGMIICVAVKALEPPPQLREALGDPDNGGTNAYDQRTSAAHRTAC